MMNQPWQENEERDQLEVSPQSLVIIQEMSRRIHRDGGEIRIFHSTAVNSILTFLQGYR